MIGVCLEGDLMKVFKEREIQCKKARGAYNRWFIFLNRLEGALYALIIVLATLGLIMIFKNPQVLAQTQGFGILLCSVPAITAFIVYLIQDIEISQAECSRMVDEYTLLENEYLRAQHLPTIERADKFNELEERLSIVQFWTGIKPPAWIAESTPNGGPIIYLPAYS